jgi:hypothetical protein
MEFQTNYQAVASRRAGPQEGQTVAGALAGGVAVVEVAAHKQVAPGRQLAEGTAGPNFAWALPRTGCFGWTCSKNSTGT